MKRCGGIQEVSFVEASYKHQEQSEKQYLFSDFVGLNRLLGNGFEPGFFYLMYGSTRIVNSMLLSLAISAQRPRKSGPDTSVVFMDNDNVFNPYSLIRLAHSVKLNPNMVLARISVARAFIWNHLGEIVDNLEDLLVEKEAKVVLISGLTTLFEGEYEPKKNQMLLEIANKLRNIAIDKQIIVVASASLAQGSVNKPAGGKIIAHTPHVLIRVIQQGERITFNLMKHPARPAAEIVQWLVQQLKPPHTRPLEHFMKK